MDEVMRSRELFAQGFHCSQAVFAAFSPRYGVSEEQALRIGGCFGSGMCRGEVCGAVTGALMAIGLANGQCDIEDVESRNRTAVLTKEMMARFSAENGSYMCRDLLGCDLATDEGVQKARRSGLFTSFCPGMVESAARIAKELLDGDRGSSESPELPRAPA